MPNPSQEPPASSIAPNKVLKDMDVLCTFKYKIESQNSVHGYIKDHWPSKINIRMLNPSQEPPASYKAPNQDLKDMDALLNFKIKRESQNLVHGYIKDH